jgi:hypothetical protein
MRSVVDIRNLGKDPARKVIYQLRLSHCHHVVERHYREGRRVPSQTWCDMCENPYGALAAAVVSNAIAKKDQEFIDSGWFDLACRYADLNAECVRRDLLYNAPRLS